MNNQEIARILFELAGFYEMEEVPFKPQAYQKAATAIAELDQELLNLYQQKGVEGFLAIPGVGKGIAEHLCDLVRGKKLKIYEGFKRKYPVDLSTLTKIEGIGPKTVKTLYQKLKIRTIEDLQKAVKEHRIAKLPGFGPRSEENIERGLEFYESHASRFLLGEVFPLVENLIAKLKGSRMFSRLEVGGSFRRRQETVGDIDILGMAKNPEAAMEFFVNMPGINATVLEHGPTLSEIKLENGLQVDLRIVPEKSWGAALQYFTGDKSHNIKLRKIAIEKGMKLSEYGLFKNQKSPPKADPLQRRAVAPLAEKIKNQKLGVINSRTEEDVYKALGMDFIPPEIRTDSGEIEAAQNYNLPKLLPYGSVRGDLQVQTNWTDGENSIEEMALAAAELGREYIAITDHTKTLYMTGGLDEKRLRQQMKEIDKINAKCKVQNAKFRILKGAEVNILKDGSLDIADEVLAKLDVVAIAIHSHFKQTSAEMTARLIRALANPYVDILFHPTTRIINRREPINFDFEKILKAAKKYQVALEIDAYPDRLDLHDTLVRKAVEAGVKLVIDTDTHHISHLGYIHLGEAQARRGWATKKDVLNTKPVEELLKYFRK